MHDQMTRRAALGRDDRAVAAHDLRLRDERVAEARAQRRAHDERHRRAASLV